MSTVTAADKDMERKILERTRAELYAERKMLVEDGLFAAEHRAAIEDIPGDGPVDKVINEIDAIDAMRNALIYRKDELDWETDDEEDPTFVSEVQKILGQKLVALYVRGQFKIVELTTENALLKKELAATKKAMKAQLTQLTKGMSRLHVGRTRRRPLVKNATEAEDEIMQNVEETGKGQKKHLG